MTVASKYRKPMNRSTCVIWILSVLLGTAVKAQTWQGKALDPGYSPAEISFSDSLHGFLLMTHNNIVATLYRTTDGGGTWDRLHAFGVYAKEQDEIFLTPTPDFALLPEIDGDRIWSRDTLQFRPHSDGYYGTNTEAMFSARDDMRLAAELDQFNRITGNYSILSTHDTFSTTVQLGDRFNGGSAARAYFADATHFWIAVLGYNGLSARIIQSTDAAQTWRSVRPIDTTMAWSTIVGSGLDSLAAIGGSNHQSNLAYSYDGGQTWTFDSTFHGHVIRAAMKGGIWVVSGPGYYKADLRTTVFGQYFGNVVSHLTPTGWVHDSTTFINDTITEMFWLDKDHGWITSVRDSVPYIYRYVVGDNAVGAHVVKAPILSLINGYVTGASPIHIDVYDVLGRKQRLIESPNGLDTHSLPPGCYIAIGHNTVLKFVK